MQPHLILGNSSRRFSGVTSTMLQVLPHQQKACSVAVLGAHHVPEGTRVIGLLEAIVMLRELSEDEPKVIFHARRNDEMIQALLLRLFSRGKLKIVFTSTAQRHHSRFTRWLIRKMDGVISTCQAAASYLREKPQIIIPHGVDPDTWYPAESKTALWKELGLPGKKGIGIFGRVREQKGVDVLIDAAIPLLKKEPDWVVIIVGEITQDQTSFFKAQQLKINRAGLAKQFVFTDKQPFARIPILFRAMSIITALSRNEGFGLTVLEAMSSAVPVIASTAGAWPEIINTNQAGRIVPIADIAATQQALSALINADDILDSLAIHARQRILEHFTVEQEASKLLAYFQSLQ
ncbi:MAG: glycosyltransferase family 4 protein [Gammaproteobacteria bacterium]|jgi:mannosyltransferase|nr:glycosyltransferase family 4 protein [Gammaproteobacteria bacterium]MBT5203466.1 glycosyltransferase family 4 protein [Gammaproteobacteria bacterium]MBT5603115.1 glycosyltransferase family 4 protein [Gammaproteobacteria bacterium]MBT6246342.1 glycosyltransferase family 4 protein [Gammaproteobacteria bacterium]